MASTASNLVLVTGGAGYIGSHTVIELIAAGYEVVVLDNLVNSSEESIRRVEEITGRKIPFHKVDLVDKADIDAVLDQYKFAAVIHFAGLKSVGESTQKPLAYYHNNITGTVYLLQAMKERGLKNFIFSSSATVYGDPVKLPIDETHPVGACTNPYGKTKYFIEEICRDEAKADSEWNIVLLRYFNPIGAHVSGKIGEDPQGIPNNLLPFVSQVAVGRREALSVMGTDWPTPDGTGVRDYIHVVDLAKGHVAALDAIVRRDETSRKRGCHVYNLGTGNGNSVLEMLKAFEKACGKELKWKAVDRRPGDIASCYADASKAERELGWKAVKTIDEGCADTWRWQSSNPNGFSSPK